VRPVDSWDEYRHDVERVLALARRHLEMDVAWVSEFEAGQQVFVSVSDDGSSFGPTAGTSSPLRDSYCLRVVDGRLPSAIPDARRNPVTRDLPGTAEVGIGCYVGVPIRTQDEAVVGMLCCAGREPRTDLGQQEVSSLSMLAALLGDLLEKSSTRSGQLESLRRRITQVVGGDGLGVVLQPIIATSSGTLVAAESLARFATARPSAWFADAEKVGMRAQLESAAARLALLRLQELPIGARLTFNLSPDLVVAGMLDDLLADADVGRLVIEITEHAPVPDYAALHRALDPHRAAGLQLAVDDAGAGYASFRHILHLRPDVIKVDMSLVARIDRDPAQQALVGSLQVFAEQSGAVLLAEGVERQDELDELARIGVPLVQGYLLSRPTAGPLPIRYRTPSIRLP
jgi:EAL domain-containing protein (putative c-di-GMP-specific phosphodiesterase class I)